MTERNHKSVPKPTESITAIKGRVLIHSLIALFLLSLSLLVFQVVMTRIFSAVLLYHYVFAVTSFAILGLGLGGMLVYKFRSISATFTANPASLLAGMSLLLAIVYLVVMTSITCLPFMGEFIQYVLYISLGMIPFICGGVLISILFKYGGPATEKLYFADMIGSGLGCLAVVYFLDSFGMIRTLIIICLLAVGASLVMSLRNLKNKVAITGMILAGLLTFLLLQTHFTARLEKDFQPFITSPYKYVGDVNRERGYPAAKILDTKWNSFARTDVIEVDSDPERKAITIDGVAFSGMYHFTGKADEIRRFTDTSGYFPSIMSLPFLIGNHKNVAMIGAGGGRDVLYALLAGSSNIAAVEINKSTVEAAQRYSSFNGNIYNRPEVKVYPEDGRTFIRKSKERFDLIFMSLVKTEAIGTIGFSLSENYIFTAEALEDYLNHLNPGGKIAFIVHHEAALAKLTATILHIYKKKAIPEREIPRYLAVINSKNLETNPDRPTFQPLLLIQNKPFTKAEAKLLMDAAISSGNTPLFIPYDLEVSRLGDICSGKATVADFTKNLPYNADPATDNGPYFYNFDHGIPGVLLFTLTGVILLAVIFFRPDFRKNMTGSTIYFSCLGIGFMLIEIPLIQKFILYLGHPTLAFTVVLFAMLTGAGIGSNFHGLEIWRVGKSKRHIAGFMVAVFAVIFMLISPVLFNLTLPFNHLAKILLTIICIIPLGFFMGMPFPFGIKQMGAQHLENEVPLMWGVNGVMTVVGSVMAIVISMLAGFDLTILIGAVVYFGVLMNESSRQIPVCI